MAANARPIWILVDGCNPVALVSLGKKRFPPGVTHWCHEGDEKWSLLTAADRVRLERRKRNAARSIEMTASPEIEGFTEAGRP